MSLRLDWKPAALRDLERLDRPTRVRIVAAVTRFAETQQGDVRKLKGQNPPEYRLRVGALRVRFAWNQEGGVLIVLSVFRRGIPPDPRIFQAVTNGSPGGKLPMGKGAARSPALSFAAAVRKAARNSE